MYKAASKSVWEWVPIPRLVISSLPFLRFWCPLVAGPATPSLYQAAQQQLDRLQQQAHAQANAASSVKSPSLIGKPSTQVSPYSQGIPYYSPREDNAGGSASTSLLRHHSYPAEARSSQQSSYFSRGPDTQAPLRRSSSGYGYSDSTPPDRTYTRHHSDSQRNYPTDRQDYSADRSGYNSDSRDYQADRREHGDGQRRDQHQSYSHTRSDMPAPRSSEFFQNIFRKYECRVVQLKPLSSSRIQWRRQGLILLVLHFQCSHSSSPSSWRELTPAISSNYRLSANTSLFCIINQFCMQSYLSIKIS